MSPCAPPSRNAAALASRARYRCCQRGGAAGRVARSGQVRPDAASALVGSGAERDSARCVASARSGADARRADARCIWPPSAVRQQSSRPTTSDSGCRQASRRSPGGMHAQAVDHAQRHRQERFRSGIRRSITLDRQDGLLSRRVVGHELEQALGLAVPVRRLGALLNVMRHWPQLVTKTLRRPSPRPPSHLEHLRAAAAHAGSTPRRRRRRSRSR